MFKKLSTLVTILAFTASANAQNLEYVKLPVPNISYQNRVAYSNFPKVNEINLEEHDLFARIQNTDKWLSIIKIVSQKYCNEKFCKSKDLEDAIYGLIMMESCGDPLLGNNQDSGGFGLVHFMPKTAQFYGLKVFEPSNTNSIIDRKNAKKIKELKLKYNNDLTKIHEFEDRAHPIKIIDETARYLLNNYQTTRSWKSAIQSINPYMEDYSDRVQHYIKKAKISRNKAKEFFNKKNKGKMWGNTTLTYDLYITQYQNTIGNNFGIGEYKREYDPTLKNQD
jgi:uncharacterized protein YeeX (DUF496 family)